MITPEEIQTVLNEINNKYNQKLQNTWLNINIIDASSDKEYIFILNNNTPFEENNYTILLNISPLNNYKNNNIYDNVFYVKNDKELSEMIDFMIQHTEIYYKKYDAENLDALDSDWISIDNN